MRPPTGSGQPGRHPMPRGGQRPFGRRGGNRQPTGSGNHAVQENEIDDRRASGAGGHRNRGQAANGGK